MKVLLTGGAGYIGSHVAAELLQSGFEVVVVDNFSNSSPEVQNQIHQAVRYTQTLEGKQVGEEQELPITFYYGDCRDGYFLDSVFREQEIDAVMHFAGLKAVGESVEKPLDYYDNNLGSTLVLLQVMRDRGVKNLIFSSSATVYDLQNPLPWTEEGAAGNCSNPYGWTKFMIEQMLKDVAKADPEWNIALLRYFNPIGAHASGCLGENPNGIPNNLLPYICRVAKANLTEDGEATYKTLKVFGNDYPTPDGTGVRDYIHVVDLAKGHVAALGYLYRHKGLEVFNLGTGRGYSVLEIVEAFERVNGVKVPYEVVERRAGDLAATYADPSKAWKELLWKTELGLDEMVRDAWRFGRCL